MYKLYILLLEVVGFYILKNSVHRKIYTVTFELREVITSTELIHLTTML